jgi:DNA-binding NtrC family response regulator
MRQPRRVMVVDDDAGVREALGLALVAEGYDVQYAKDGGEGLALLARRPADLVIVDMRMPEVDGKQFCRTYAQEGGTSPIILMTAMAGRAIATDLPGVVEAVAKPFDLEYLLDLVARMISRFGPRRD